MMPGQPFSAIPQCKQNRPEGACLELFQAIGRLEPIFLEAHHASKMICMVRSLKSQTKTRSFLEEILTSSKEVFKDCESDMVVNIRMLGNPIRKTAESNVIV